MQQYGEMGTYFCHNRGVLLSEECATRAAAAEGCLEDRAPGRQVVAQRWHLRGLLPLSTQEPASCPQELSEFKMAQLTALGPQVDGQPRNPPIRSHLPPILIPSVVADRSCRWASSPTRILSSAQQHSLS